VRLAPLILLAGCASFDVWPSMDFPDDPQGTGACARPAPDHEPTDAELRACLWFKRPAFDALRARLARSPAFVELGPEDAISGDAMRAIGAFRADGGGGEPTVIWIYRFGIVPSGASVSLISTARGWTIERDHN
jgi:hypothetical protein